MKGNNLKGNRKSSIKWTEVPSRRSRRREPEPKEGRSSRGFLGSWSETSRALVADEAANYGVFHSGNRGTGLDRTLEAKKIIIIRYLV